jgi:hypothetical protein
MTDDRLARCFPRQGRGRQDRNPLSDSKRDPSLPMVVQDRHPSSGVRLTITGVPPMFFISVASKGLRVYVSGLESTLAGISTSDDSKETYVAPKLCNSLRLGEKASPLKG